MLDKVFYQGVFKPLTKISEGFYISKNKNRVFLCVTWGHESLVFQISLIYFYVKRPVSSDLLDYNFKVFGVMANSAVDT